MAIQENTIGKSIPEIINFLRLLRKIDIELRKFRGCICPGKEGSSVFDGKCIGRGILVKPFVAFEFT